MYLNKVHFQKVVFFQKNASTSYFEVSLTMWSFLWYFQLQLWTVATPSGKLLLFALWRLEMEHKHLQEPAPIPHHPTAEKTVVTLGRLKRQCRATNKNAVCETASFMLFLFFTCWVVQSFKYLFAFQVHKYQKERKIDCNGRASR